MSAEIKTALLVIALSAIALTGMYGLKRLGEGQFARKRERCVAVITRGFSVTSEDAGLIFDICTGN